MRYQLAVLAAICTLAAPAAASTVTAEANVARSEGDWGGELTVGLPVIEDGGFALTPGAGVFFHKRSHDGFYEDGSDCFRRSDDAQVSDGQCDDSGTKVFFKAEATYRLPTSLAFGIGARFISGDLRPYGTVAFPLAPHFDVKANLGDHYLAAGVQARF